MNTQQFAELGRKSEPLSRAPYREPEASIGPSRKAIRSVGVLYAHAFTMENEAKTRYLEFAAHMSDIGNDTVADLFCRLAEFEAEHAFHLAKKSVGVEIPLLDAAEYAWLDCGAPLPEAHAFVFRMLTPRLALEIALRAEERAKAFYEQVQAETRNAHVQELAIEFASEEASHIDWVKDALAHLPQPFRPTEEQPDNPAIDQQQ